MSKKLTCITIDDDKLFQTIMSGFISKTDILDLRGTFDNALEASQFLSQSSVDILFLDIEMPFMSGLEFIKTLTNPPQIILVSSSKEYALDAFEYNVTDYLLKPLENYERFLTAVKKAQNNIENEESYTTKGESIFIKVDNELTKLEVSDIYYIEAFGDYIKIYTHDHVLVVYTTLKSFLEKLPKEDFIQTHRSYIVRIEKIVALTSNNVKIEGRKVPVSRSFKENIQKALISN